MFVLTITDNETGHTEQATVKGRRVLSGHHTPDRKESYAPSIVMADTVDLLCQFRLPSKVKALFDEASAPRFALTLRHI